MNKTTKRILLVEDEPHVADIVVRLLAGGGAEVVTAATIKEAEPLLDAGRLDLVILDRLLPDGDGVQLFARIKRNPELRNLPVLILSAKDYSAEKAEGLDLGADDYVPKPFSPAELRARVAALLRRAEKFAPRDTGRAGAREKAPAPGCEPGKKR